MYELTDLDRALMDRAGDQCEICKAENDLRAFAVAPYDDEEVEHNVLLCATCRGQLTDEEPMDSNHWYGLQETIWSEIPAVQVLSWRVLHKLVPETWASELLDQAYLMDDVMEWAKQGLEEEGDEEPRVVDANGTPLKDGDSVTILKDLDVKGGGFVAKRGTTVKDIRLIDDPTHIDGKVNGIGVYLKTEFLRKV